MAQIILMSNRSPLAAAVLMALVVLVSAVFVTAAPASGQGDTTPAPFCIIHYPDGRWYYVDCPPTPTPEHLPTSTPAPTSTPTPEPQCVITARDNINVRAVPGGEWLGVFPAESQTIPLGQHYWTNINYYLIWWPPLAREVWVADFFDESDAAICEALPDVNPFEVAPSGAAFLIHTEVGVSADELAQMYAVFAANGIQSGVKAVNVPDICAHAIAHGQVCVARDLLSGDCPNVLADDPVAEAERWLRVIEPQVFAGGVPTLVEPVNECCYDDLAWWNTFMLTAIELAQDWGWPPLALPSMPPGHEESGTITAWKPALTALLDSGGCMSMHLYGFDTNLTNGNVYTSYRHRLVRAFLVGAGLSDLDVCVTEAAAYDGYAAADLGDFAAWYDEVRDDPHLRLVAAYHAGLGRGPAADLRGYLVTLAYSIH